MRIELAFVGRNGVLLVAQFGQVADELHQLAGLAALVQQGVAADGDRAGLVGVQVVAIEDLEGNFAGKGSGSHVSEIRTV